MSSTRSAYRNPLEEYARSVASRIRAEVLEGKLLSHDLSNLELGKQTVLFSNAMGIKTICGTCGKTRAFFRCHCCSDLAHCGPRCCTPGKPGDPHKCFACGSKTGIGPMSGQHQEPGLGFGDISFQHEGAPERPYLMIDAGSAQRDIRESRFDATFKARIQVEQLA